MEDSSISSSQKTIPTQFQRGLVFTPWQFILFKQLSSDVFHDKKAIDVNDLIEAYELIMRSNNLISMPREWLINQLTGSSIHNNFIIEYQSFNSSLKWFIKIKSIYGDSIQASDEIIKSLNKKYYNWHRNGLIVFTTCVDVVVAMLIILTKLQLSGWLIFARISAIMILTNIAYILIPFISAHILANLFPAEYSHYYHNVFGIKILFFSITHIIGHICQIIYALHHCNKGCSQESISIVPISQSQIVISYGYFVKQYPYYTGILLMIIFGLLVLSFLLFSLRQIRYSTNQLFHKYLGITGFIMIIAHGHKQLLGFNYSYILTLPLLLKYFWNRRYEVFRFHIQINRWVITPTTVLIYLKDDHRLNKILESFENVSIYVNYSKVSLLEWHPFTLTRGYNSTDAVLYMKRVGNWTNKIADKLLTNINSEDTISVGHYLRSKFRFHRLYKIRYFFCSGIGITGFLACMADTMRVPIPTLTQTTLIWSINSIEMINEFSERIRYFESKLLNVKVLIYYSNRSNKNVIPYQALIRFSYLQSIIYGTSKIDIVTGMISPICCRFERVNFIEILSTAALAAHRISFMGSIGVFICGSEPYAIQCLNNIDIINRNKLGISFRAWSESV